MEQFGGSVCSDPAISKTGLGNGVDFVWDDSYVPGVVAGAAFLAEVAAGSSSVVDFRRKESRFLPRLKVLKV
jgi:hypothetical protein